jgi:hypothetical protein
MDINIILVYPLRKFAIDNLSIQLKVKEQINK